MASPWQQAEKLVESNVRWLKEQTKNAVPTQPQKDLETMTSAWTSDVLDNIGLPAWVFIYSPTSSSQLYEWAGNVGPTGLDRASIGFAKLQTIKSNGGLVFLGAWINKKFEKSKQ